VQDPDFKHQYHQNKTENYQKMILPSSYRLMIVIGKLTAILGDGLGVPILRNKETEFYRAQGPA
jgi:hypothetical protein